MRNATGDAADGAPERRRGGRESLLALLALLGQAITYAISIQLARGLGVDGFDDYAVASAVFMLLAAVAPLGSEKYALRVLPVYIERGDWPRARSYLHFGLRRTLGMSVLLAVAVIAGSTWPGLGLADTTRRGIVVAALGIPLGALVHFGLEALTASGRELAALAIFRIVVPVMAAAGLGLLWMLDVRPDAVMALACWAPAWLLALALMAAVGRRGLPAEMRRAASINEARHWRSETRPFFVYRLALGLLGQSGLIALALLHAPAAAIGAYAAAVGTAGLATTLATATNRAYGRRLSILLERHDYPGVLQLRRERLRWMLPTVAMFLSASFLFGRELLALFRPEFADQGVAALRILAIGASVAVLLALAPTYLKYRRRKRATYMALACAALAQWLLLLLLVPPLGATGAAAAYTASMVGMYGAFALIARLELRRFRRASAADDPTER